MCVKFGQPGVTARVHVIHKKRAPLLNCIHGDGRIPGAPADATKRLCAELVSVGLGSNEFAIGGAGPKVGAAGMEKASSNGTEGTDQLAGIAALKRCPRKL
jgi:hypothetical protein